MADYRRDRTGQTAWKVLDEFSTTTANKAIGAHRRETRTVTTKREWLHVELSCGHWNREESKPEPLPICFQCKYGEPGKEL